VGLCTAELVLTLLLGQSSKLTHVILISDPLYSISVRMAEGGHAPLGVEIILRQCAASILDSVCPGVRRVSVTNKFHQSDFTL
jgi:hypothetical protein